MISMHIDDAEALATGAKDEGGGRKLAESVRGAEMRTVTPGKRNRRATRSWSVS